MVLESVFEVVQWLIAVPNEKLDTTSTDKFFDHENLKPY